MRLLSLVLLVTLSYVSSAAIESKICIQGGPVPPECPNNNKWNSVTCKFECLPHCVSNEGAFVFPDATTGGTTFRRLCNSCNCKVGGTIGICTKMGCDTSLCWDDDGKPHQQGEVITRGCKTGTCTKGANGKGVWSWYNPASATTKPNCPYGTASFNQDTCQWDCPRTCDDGSTPPKCLQQPCATVRCGFNTVCVDNYCPNFPVPNQGRCTAQCVTPVQCAKDPCQSPLGQPKCGKNQVCEADYRFGCNYQCKDAPTCEFNDQTFQLGESRPSEDGCNTCSCSEDGWVCTLKACPQPTDKPICMIQGGKVPDECPNNNKWNSKTCKFECVCPQNQNCGINGVWDYDNCRCVVKPAPPQPTDKPICIQGGKVPDECPNNNKWNSETCQFECLPHCVSNEGAFVFGGDRFFAKCNGCTCNADGSSTCTRIGCDNSLCYDDAGKPYTQGATLTRGCKTATCTKDSNGQGVWKWVDPASQQPPRCDLSPATFDQATCKWSCPKTCADGSNPPNCLVNPCATILCAANSQCVVNSCPNYPNTENGPCTATCQPITNCLVSPCSVNSCGKGQTCVDDYVGGCNYRCKDKFRM